MFKHGQLEDCVHKKYVVVKCRQQLFGIPESLTRGVLRYQRLFQADDSPKWLLGSLVFQGRSIPVIDFLFKWEIGKKLSAGPACSIVVVAAECAPDYAVIQFGILVDKFIAVYQLDPEKILASSDKEKLPFAGMANIDSSVFLVDVNRIATSEELSPYYRDL